MTKRAHRNSDGNLVVNNVTQSSHMKYFEGSRAQVFNGTAYQTSGGLQKKDLIQLKSRRIVSKKKTHLCKARKSTRQIWMDCKKRQIWSSAN